jgi:hypothetical protein
MALREIARSLGVEAERLTIGRDGRIPTIELDGVRTALSLSLSHHGRWIAHAMRLHVAVCGSSISNRGRVESIGRIAGRGWTG